MFNKKYQQNLKLTAGEIARKNKNNLFCKNWVELLCKYSIHIFVANIIISMLGMAYVFRTTDLEQNFDKEIDEQVKLQNFFINNNPMYYGLASKFSSSGKISMGLKKFSEKQSLSNFAPNHFIHPVYVFL